SNLSANMWKQSLQGILNGCREHSMIQNQYGTPRGSPREFREAMPARRSEQP
nr:hypothetical protein [Tanacetum cinerariifolium]